MSQKPQISQSGGPSIQNKKAFFNYQITEKVEAGLVLLGTEVKSLRDKQCELDASYARIDGSQCWLIGCKIAPYDKAAGANHEPLRKRKLLLHKAQIKKLTTKLQQRGFTLIPLRIYFGDRGLAKIELGLARGKRQYDKRQKIQEKDQKRQIKRDIKRYK